MKKLTEIKFEELTTKQKLSMVHAAYISGKSAEEEKEYIFDLIRNRALGAVWIQWNTDRAQENINKVREIADYPILIITDAESGLGDYLVGRHNAIGCTGKEEYAYAFGKAVGVTAGNMGYNVVCNPVLDIKENGFGFYEFKVKNA